jgi:Protein of unknown function (DUF3631)/DnaB-like helicase N terminal domain
MLEMRARKKREQPSLWQVAFDTDRRVVASCLLSPPLFSKCGVLAPTHFTNSDCRAVWSVMAKFHQQGSSWDSSSVASELHHQGAAEPEATLVRLTEGAVETIAIERAAAKVRQMSLRCRAVKGMEGLQRALLDPASDLNQTIQSTRRLIESFAAEYEEIQLGPSPASHNPGASSVGADVLDEIAVFVQRFVILSRSELLVISLWVAHTWAFDASDATPYLAVTSAEMRSGKTRLLEILELLVRSPWRTGRVTPAALARRIESDCPTLLLDEWDATARGAQEFTETLRAILNAGHRRNGNVSVCGPKSAGYQPTDFCVFCPKVIAGIGKLPETIADRAIPIRLKRKAPGEKVDRFRAKKVLGDSNNLKARLRAWVCAHLKSLNEAHPELPECLSDRQQDGAEPLLAIADAAGGDWPTRARAALTDLHSSNNAAEESLGVNLLSDIRDIFFETDAEELSSKELIGALSKLDGRPWPALDHSGPITPNVLARLLAPFDIFPRNLRTGRLVLKGYKRAWFSDGWNRYLTPLALPIPGPTDATPLQPAKELTRVQLYKKPPEPDVAASEPSLRARLEGSVAP